MHEDITRFQYPLEAPFCIQMTGVSYCDGKYKIVRPNSSIYCIEYVIEGHGRVSHDGESFVAKKGDIYLLSAGKNHDYYSDAKDPWTKIWFNIYGDLVAGILESYRLTGVSHVEGLNLLSLFRDFLETAQSGLSVQETFDRCALVFLEIIQRIAGHLRPSGAQDSLARVLRRMIDEMTDFSFTLDDLTARLYCSKSHAIRVFKAEFGVTPYQYILSKKLSQAKIMLRNTHLPVGEISAQLGFSSSHYFSTFFKEQTGLPPLLYRQKAHPTK